VLHDGTPPEPVMHAPRQVRRRDRRLAEFDVARIERAVAHAAGETHRRDPTEHARPAASHEWSSVGDDPKEM
jgi:hypothetical protein